MTETIKLLTKDNFEIIADYYNSSSPSSIVLLHMLGQTKESWENFPEELFEKGLSVISLDLRGHGKSIIQEGKERSWSDFSEDDFNNMVFDVFTVKEYLLQNGKKNISICGASIGANIAFMYAAKDKDIKSIALLAPGVNYRGVDTTEAAINYDENRGLLVVLAQDDPHHETGKEIFENIKSSMKELKEYETGGHGTELLHNSDDAREFIADWIFRHS